MKDENVIKDSSGIKADPKGTESKPFAPPKAAQPPAAKTAAEKPPTRYVIAKGKTVPCAGGRKRPGYSVTPRDVGGQKHFDQLLASGAIVEK